MLAVITGLIGTFPVGGITWHYLQYVLGFRRLGWTVVYLEDTGQWTYLPSGQTYTSDPTANVAYLSDAMKQFDLADSWSFRGLDGNYYGLSAEQVRRACSDADLFLNISGSCWLRPQYRSDCPTVYLDTDPGYNQFRIAAVANGSTDRRLTKTVDGIAAHTHHLTFAENIGKAECDLPSDLFDWRTTRQPIYLDAWEPAHHRPRPVFTTVLSWNPYAKPLVFDGHEYYGKEPRFQRIMELPQRVGPGLEAAMGNWPSIEKLESYGWTIIDARSVSHDMGSYRDYLRNSMGELSVAKDVYVETRSGWFSERSACYLASGRPVVVEDTGFSGFLPTDEGILPFTSLEQAAWAIDEINGNYERHAAAARSIAEEYFDSDKVLGHLIDTISE
jgi:hypothetical protein